MYSMHAAVNRQVKNRAALSIWSVTTRIVTIKMYIWGISWCNTHTHRDPIRQWHRNESEAKRWTFFCWWCPSTFLALQVQLVVLVSAFVMVNTVWSVSCLLFFYSRCPPWACAHQPFVKVGCTCPVHYGVGAAVIHQRPPYGLSRFLFPHAPCTARN